MSELDNFDEDCPVETLWRYGIVQRGDEFSVHEIFYDVEGSEVGSVSWSEEPVALSGFLSADDARRVADMVLSDVSSGGIILAQGI